MIRRFVAFLMFISCLWGNLALAFPHKDSFLHPVLSDTLETCEERTEPLSLHYWDKFDFKDSLWLTDLAQVEQDLVNYLNLLSGLEKSVATLSVKAFVGKVYSNEAARLYFTDEVEHYLFDLNSSRRNDNLYIIFLKETLASPYLKEGEKFRYRFQLENIMKNMPGDKATDFSYLDKKGNQLKMSDLKADYLVLFFYNPDCERCRDAKRHLSQEAVLKKTSVRVLAVYPGSQTKEWLAQPSDLPAGWIDGCSPDGAINNRLLYFIRTTPSVYLLDKHKRVILKDISSGYLVKYLRELKL